MEKKNKKGTGKIILLSLINILLAGLLVFLIYITFIADSTFTKLGYSYGDINAIHKYKLEEKITEYNQSLVYALNSQDFKESNIEYYMLFNSQIDYTRIINDLADKYSVEELTQLKAVISEDEIIELVDLEKISNVSSFQQLNKKGYNLKTAVSITNKLSEEELSSFLQLPVLETPEKFIQYLETGYDCATIVALYNHSAEDFNNLAGIQHFEELSGLLEVEGFKTENLARYLWHMHNWDSSYERAVTRVNGNYDYTAPSSIDFSSFYTSKEQEADTSTLTVLVNKSYYLSSDYIPADLVEVDAAYRGANQQLVKEVAEAFIKMSDDCYSATERRILAYSNYRSYQLEQSNYDQYVIDAGEDSKFVDSYAPKAGYNEHQLGLTVDIAQQSYLPNELAECKSYDWLIENSYQYGFIRRYTLGNEWITGLTDCSYQFRYVGEEAATIIHTYDWVLEEYAYLFQGLEITQYN